VEEGTVKFYNKARGFGFITKNNGKDIFVHVSGVENRQELDEGDGVFFETGEDRKGRATAVNVKKMDGQRQIRDT